MANELSAPQTQGPVFEDGSPAQVHQVGLPYESSEQEAAAGKLATWLLIATEIAVFAGLFCAFAVYRAIYFDSFVEARQHLSKFAGIVSTGLLLTSSLTVALAVRSVQLNQRIASVIALVGTMVLALGFLNVKAWEFSEAFHHKLLPGALFHGEGFTSSHPGLYFALYFLLTGIHALHVLVGIIVVGSMASKVFKGVFSSRYFGPLENVGLYWHLLTLVWLFLFPLFYLVG